MATYNEQLVRSMGNLGEIGCEDRNVQLYEAIRTGDPVAKQAMIENNMPLVIYLVKRLIQQRPPLAVHHDDLQAEGFLKLADTVNEMATAYAPVDDPTAYLARCLKRHLADQIPATSLVAASAKTHARTAQKGEEVSLPHVHTVGLLVHSAVEYEDQIAVMEAREIIDSCCVNADERTIVEMREQGYALKEIADAVLMSTTNTFRALVGLGERVQRRLNELKRKDQ